jgi:polyhydroxybutyrate depolymerase
MFSLLLFFLKPNKLSFNILKEQFMNKKRHSKIKTLSINLLIISAISACGGGGDSKKPAIVEESNRCGKSTLNSSQSCIVLDNRSTISYVPASGDQYSGIAIFLHGAPGTPTKVSNIFGSKMIADKFNLVSLVPEGNGSNYEWNSTNNGLVETPDIDFLTSLIDNVQSKYTFSDEKVYVFGYSAGGFMAYKLACQIPEKLTAIISLAGQFRGDFDACSTSTPIALHHLHSAIDKDVPFDGRINGGIASVPDTIAFWQHKNGCSDVIEETIQGGVTATSSKTLTEKYTGCVNSVALSHLDLVDHEDVYVADSLLATYEYLLK